MAGDLAILSAEEYGKGRFGGPVMPAAARKSSRQSSSGGEDTPTLKKRSRAQNAESGDGDEEEKKRTRGRPRLDTKDETAQDRRRTQIRLAQRAYRNRKENAIQTLEKTVQGLRETNEEMTNAFVKFHEFVLRQGLLDCDPDLGRQLREASDRFVALNRKSSEDSDGGDDTGLDAQNDQFLSRDIKSPSPEAPTKVEPPSSRIPRGKTLFGGLVVEHEPVAEPEPEPVDTSFLGGFTGGLPTPRAAGFEWVTTATIDNASFPVMPPTDAVVPYLSSLSPYPNITTPKTFSSHENSFGRRLQRLAVEHALKLISMKNPEPQRFARVFGFCMLFEPIDSIRRRLRMAVERTKQEPLHHWQYPFVHLGGAGTHYDTSNMPHGLQPMGHQGIIDNLRPKDQTGLSTGPFDADVIEARGKFLDEKLRMVVPGFQGEFFDCDEVEFYLHNRGVSIPASADMVPVEVDTAAFEDTDPPTGLFPPKGSDTAAMIGLHGLDVADAILSSESSGGAVPFVSHHDSAMGSSIGGPGSSGAPSDSLSPGPSPSDNPMAVSLSQLPMQEATPDVSLMPLLQGSANAYAGDIANNNFFALNNFMGGNSAAVMDGKKRTFILDVNLLVHELVERTTCLGRTPGFRPKDVNAAFWIATRSPS